MASGPVTALPEAIVFDMDGLIFDTEALYARALREIASELDLPAIDRGVIDATIGLSWSNVMRLMGRLVGDRISAAALIKLWQVRYDLLCERYLVLKPGVRELLASLDALGIRAAIATGSFRQVVERHLEAHDLRDAFEVLITHEDYQKGKPAPDPFTAAASALHLPPQRCWALEDSLHGVSAAHAASMTTIMVPDLVAPDEEARRRCFAILPSLHAVRDLLLGYAPLDIRESLDAV